MLWSLFWLVPVLLAAAAGSGSRRHLVPELLLNAGAQHHEHMPRSLSLSVPMPCPLAPPRGAGPRAEQLCFKGMLLSMALPDMLRVS